MSKKKRKGKLKIEEMNNSLDYLSLHHETKDTRTQLLCQIYCKAKQIKKQQNTHKIYSAQNLSFSKH